MPILLIVLVAVGVLLLVGVVFLALIYNGLVALKNRWLNAYAQIDVQLKRRYDLIPNLVETAKGYLAHERETLEAVIAARNSAAAANGRAAAGPGTVGAIAGVAAAEGVLRGQLGRFIGLAEAYPELKGDQTMLRLMEELSSTENRVAFARQAYNDSVMSYNTARQSFPAVVVASPLGFTPADLFQIDDQAQRQAVKVDLQRSPAPSMS